MTTSFIAMNPQEQAGLLGDEVKIVGDDKSYHTAGGERVESVSLSTHKTRQTNKTRQLVQWRRNGTETYA